MDRVVISGISYNISALDGISEAEFITRCEGHYKTIGKGRIDKMKSDYKELKKHFTKKEEKEEKKKVKEIKKAED